MEVIEKIRTLRELKNMSQEELADMIHMSKEGYAKIERGERGLDIQRLESIATALSVSVADLLSITDKSKLYLINETKDNGQSNYLFINKDTNHSTYHFNSDKDLVSEIEKLKIQLQHKDELLQQKENENQLLKEMIATLKNLQS